eukprot:1887902-Pyramimonas_sp.AAC.1
MLNKRRLKHTTSASHVFEDVSSETANVRGTCPDKNGSMSLRSHARMDSHPERRCASGVQLHRLPRCPGGCCF